MNKYIDSEWSVTLISHIGNALSNKNTIELRFWNLPLNVILNRSSLSVYHLATLPLNFSAFTRLCSFSFPGRFDSENICCQTYTTVAFESILRRMVYMLSSFRVIVSGISAHYSVRLGCTAYRPMRSVRTSYVYSLYLSVQLHGKDRVHPYGRYK